MEDLSLSDKEISKSNSNKKIRKQGLVPGIIYSKNYGNYMFEVGEIELNKCVSNVGEHGVIDAKLDGNNIKAIIKEIQREPISKKILHIDLQKVDDKDYIQTDVPIVLENEDSLTSKGYIVQKEKNSIKVQCNIDDLPNKIRIDISDLDSLKCLKAKDLKLNDNLIILENPETVIATIVESNIQLTSNDEDENVILNVNDDANNVGKELNE